MAFQVWLQQTRIGLSLYDVAGRGYLRESDLENYILELIPTLPQLGKGFYFVGRIVCIHDRILQKGIMLLTIFRQ